MRERELWGKVKRSTKIRNHLIGIILQKDIQVTLRSPRWIGLTTKNRPAPSFNSDGGVLDELNYLYGVVV